MENFIYCSVKDNMTKNRFLSEVTFKLTLSKGPLPRKARSKRLECPGLMCRILPITVGNITNKKSVALWCIDLVLLPPNCMVKCY